jgi:hypothetical protein
MEAALDEPARDERMRRLQRIAYGAVASDTERAAALSQLEALRRESVETEAVAETGSVTSGPPRERTPTGSTRAASEWIAACDAASVRRFQWAVAAGTVALLLGVAVGWQFGARMEPSEPAAQSSPVGPSESGPLMIPVAETQVPRLFDMEPTPADMPAVPTHDDRIAPTDYRLLVTRPDGVALHVARVDGDVCVVVVQPDWGSASGCTVDGRFPETGVWVESRGQGSTIRGTIHPDGTSELTPVGYLPDRLPAAEG